jgi:hypothetical protein
MADRTQSVKDPSATGVDLYWIPLGAGGHVVRLNGRIYEAIQARRQRRRPMDLYHTALVVRIREGRFTIEMAWPIPRSDGRARGVVARGPVGHRRLGRVRLFRYEVRRWRDGVIPDLHFAVASRRLSEDPSTARRVLDLTASAPALVWGRDELGVGEMWNSNSLISWLLASSGLPVETVAAPAGGRAPGWTAGIVAAHDPRHLAPAVVGEEASRRAGTGTNPNAEATGDRAPQPRRR